MPNKAAANLASNLKALMEADEELSSGPKIAAKGGVSQKTVSNVLSARNSTTLKTLQRLADIFRVPPFALLAPPEGNMLTILRTYLATDEGGRQIIEIAETAANGRIGGAAHSNKARKAGG